MLPAQTVNIINSNNTIKTINSAVDATELVVTKIDLFTKKIIRIIISFCVIQSKQFIKFLVDKNVVSAGIAIIVGTQIGKITGSFVEYLLAPFINLILAGKTKSFNDYEFEVYTIRFKIGLFLTNLIQFFINMLMVYYVFKMTQFSSTGFNSFLNSTVAMETVNASQ